MREHTSTPRLAAAIWVGAFIGTSPFYGGHVVLCLVLSFVLRLNKLAVWAASNVSLPFLAPFLIFLCVHVGHLMLRGTFAPMTVAGIRELVEQDGVVEIWWLWLAGWVPVGSIVGLVCAGATVVALRARRAQPPPA